MGIETQALPPAQRSTDDDWSQPEIQESFSVHDDATANWVVWEIVKCRSYAARCDQWCGREKNRARRDEEFFLFKYGPQLRDYAKQKIAEGKNRRKSVNLPAGTVGFRKENAKLVVDDDDLVLAWAREHVPELVTTIEKVSKTALNEHLESTGEIPQRGAHIEPEREHFYVK
jgi:phage host-nuclease inhibitor protein Gam